MADLVQFCSGLQRRHLASTSDDYRRHKGQVFTPPEIAAFMAGLFSRIPPVVRILDPGAGAGILTAAICERVTGLRASREVEAHLFESDSKVATLLTESMRRCSMALTGAGHSFKFYIHAEDFIAAAGVQVGGAGLFESHGLGEFNLVISNPPYFKVRKDSLSARVMSRVVSGQPNAYSFFMAIAASLLADEGELVAITPRSFCNGPYFRRFRRWFFDRVSLSQVHLFESRTDTFRESNVLQESVITKVTRTSELNPTVTITTSHGRDVRHIQSRDVPRTQVLADEKNDCVIRIPSDDCDHEIVEFIDSLPARFLELGFRISTGPVVMFRASEHLLYELNGEPAVPLLLPHNVGRFVTRWPVQKAKKPIAFRVCPESRGLLVAVRNYVLLKRFSAKEEKRRLTAGCFLRREHQFDAIGIENHLNYVYHAGRELDENEVFGLGALFNSYLFDRYFRAISGNTQVNATEIRALPVPDSDTIARIGERVSREPSMVEQVVAEELDVHPRLRTWLLNQTA